MVKGTLCTNNGSIIIQIMLLLGMIYIPADLHVQFVSLQQFLHQSRGEIDVPLFPGHATGQ